MTRWTLFSVTVLAAFVASSFFLEIDLVSSLVIHDIYQYLYLSLIKILLHVLIKPWRYAFNCLFLTPLIHMLPIFFSWPGLVCPLPKSLNQYTSMFKYKLLLFLVVVYYNLEEHKSKFHHEIQLDGKGQLIIKTFPSKFNS